LKTVYKSTFWQALDYLGMPTPNQLITQVTAADYSTIAVSDFNCPMHLHHFHQLDVILDGQVSVFIDDKTEIKATRGTSVLIPPLCRHGYSAKNGFRQISFKFYLSPQHWARFGHEHHKMKLPEYRLYELENCGKNLQLQSSLAQQQALAALSLCLISLAETIKSAPNSNHENTLLPQLWQLLENIEARPYDSWSVSEMARSSHLSVDHFSRCFHRLLGVTPQHYLLESRMRAAATDLLNDTAIPIKHIAENAGYATVHAFSRAFKIVFDISPAAYRRAPRQF
jgi:AraC-like DNA-binding protein